MSSRRSTRLTTRGRLVLGYYLRHSGAVPLHQAEIARKLLMTTAAVAYHVRWLLRGEALEPIPGSPKRYQITPFGRALLGAPPPKQKARRFCRCAKCGWRVDLPD